MSYTLEEAQFDAAMDAYYDAEQSILSASIGLELKVLTEWSWKDMDRYESFRDSFDWYALGDSEPNNRPTSDLDTPPGFRDTFTTALAVANEWGCWCENGQPDLCLNTTIHNIFQWVDGRLLLRSVVLRLSNLSPANEMASWIVPYDSEITVTLPLHRLHRLSIALRELRSSRKQSLTTFERAAMWRLSIVDFCEATKGLLPHAATTYWGSARNAVCHLLELDTSYVADIASHERGWGHVPNDRVWTQARTKAGESVPRELMLAGPTTSDELATLETQQRHLEELILYYASFITQRANDELSVRGVGYDFG